MSVTRRPTTSPAALCTGRRARSCSGQPPRRWSAHIALCGRARYSLLVFDGYRPWRVTKPFWDVTPFARREFVADPAKGSKHNRGCAVDLSLYDLKIGHEVEMPSAYDEMTPRAYPDYSGGPPAARKRRDLLRATMEREGFTVEPNERWHFNYKD